LPAEEFDFNLEAAKQKIKAKQSSGNAVFKGNPRPFISPQQSFTALKPIPLPRLQPLVDIKIPPGLTSRSAARIDGEPSTGMMSFPAAMSVVTLNTTLGTAMAQKSNATLIVSDLALGTSEGQLRKLFSQIGPIKQLMLLAEGNKAVVTFSDPRDAVGCRRRFHRSPINGSVINVSFT
jgi:hypothetical protein